MKKYIYTLFALCALSFTACSDSDANGENNENQGTTESTDAANLKVNTYAIAGNVVDFGSVAVMMVGENLSIVATPEQGVESAEDILGCEEYLFAAINPMLIGKEFDLKSENSLYTFMSTLIGAELETVAPDLTDEIEAGTALFTYQNEVLNVKADLTLVGGITLSFHAEAKYKTTINENKIYSIYGEKPLRATFYLEEDGLTYLYFTPAGISYAEELEIATWYLYMVVESTMVSGKTIDVATIGDSDVFMFGMVDNVDDSNSLDLSSGSLEGVIGEFNIKRNGEGNYTAIVDIEYEGNRYAVEFAGECISFNEQMPVEQNFIVYEGEKLNLTSASLTKAESVWSVELKVEDGSTIVATAPATFFDGNARGFSQSADLTVSYDGVTYSKANGHSGTFQALLDEAEGQLTLDFTNYENLELNYNGSITIN